MNFNVKNKRTQSSFSVATGQTILTAAIESGLALPHSCRAGNCGSCKARLVSGKIDHSDFDETALNNQQYQQGFILLCRAKAKTDIEVDIEEFTEQTSPARFWPARIKQLKLLCHDVMQLKLELPPGKKIEYLPGQYIDMVISGNRRRSFSIANSNYIEYLECHIRLVPDGEFTCRIFEHYNVGNILRLYGPLGTFFLRNENAGPIIMLAGGTGFAPLKALLEQLAKINTNRSVILYWGVCKLEDIYMKFWLEQFNQLYDWFNFTVVLSEPDDTWSGRKGFIHQAVLDDYDDLAGYDVYASGPPKMITAAKQSFIEKGLNRKHFYFDSFDYATDTMAQINQQTSL